MSALVLEMQPRPSRLAELEQVVERGQRSFVEAGKALRTIRNERLYDAAFGTFEAYCRARFGMTPQHINRIIAASEVVGNLEPMGSNDPISERVARPLAMLKKPDDQRKVWSEATERWNKPTAAQVSEVIGEMFPKPGTKTPPQRTDPTGPTSRLVLVLDDLVEVAKVLSNTLEISRLIELHALLGERVRLLRNLTKTTQE